MLDERLVSTVGFVRVVELTDDPFDVHLVAEAARRGRTPGIPDYRAPTTVCGRVGFRETARTANACPECERATPDAVRAAIAACCAGLGASP